MATAETVTVSRTRAFADRMAAHNGQVLAQVDAAVADLSGQGMTGPVIAALNRVRELYAQVGAAWREVGAAIDGHETLGEQVRNTEGVASDMGYYTKGAGPTLGTGTNAASAAPTNPVKDPLRVGARMVLRDGETFAGSASTKDGEGSLLLAAAVDTPTGRQVHVGVPIDPEDRKNWRGGHAPTQETEVDEEDGEEYHVDTGADVTAVLDAADAAKLPEQVEAMIAKATAVDKECRQVGKERERLYDQRARLEAQRFGGETAGERKISLDGKVNDGERTQARRRRHVDRAADRLDPADRAAHDARQQAIDAAGRDGWEPGREADAAHVCGLSVDEFEEMKRLKRIPHQRRTRAEDQRLDELAYGGGNVLHPALPPLLAEQAALVCGLTVDEYREMERLEAIPKPSHLEHCNRNRRVRTPQEQARLDELDASPRGATGASQRDTYKLRARYLSALKTHHSSKTTVAHAREDQTAMEATAKPLGPAAAAELERVTAELDEASRRYDAMAGWPSATVEVPARNGGSLVFEAIQREEDGGVDYRIDRRPADADEDWSSPGDPYSTTAGGLRKAAGTIAGLAGTS